MRGEEVPGVNCSPALNTLSQSALAGSRGSRISIAERREGTSLSQFVNSGEGSSTGDANRFLRRFWEVGCEGDWYSYCGPGYVDSEYCDSSLVVFWQKGAGELSKSTQARIQNTQMWSRMGVLVGRVRGITATLFNGGCFSKGAVLVCPKNETDLLPIYSFLRSSEYERYVRTIDPRVSAATSVITDVPFNIEEWRDKATKNLLGGLPSAPIAALDQVTCDGSVSTSNLPLQTAVARLVGYRWPRQTGSSFPSCPSLDADRLKKHADNDGIVCLSSIGGEASAADRLRALLADAYGSDWSSAKLTDLLNGAESLELWLRDQFFEEHCRTFQQCPFVWHIWDGRDDGFHVLVNYHKLAAPNGEGRKSLEKLIFTSLGDWITRQRAEVASGSEGADGRLTAALHLKGELEKILAGEKPYDIFVRWKPLDQQPISWDPDLNDGVRMNIRPWLTANLAPSTKPKKGSCILRVTPAVSYGKDKGKEHWRTKEDFPWFWAWDGQTEDFEGGNEFDGARWNDLHYSPTAKQQARERRRKKEGA